MPYHYCYEVYHGNCFLCSGIFCIGLAEFVKDKDVIAWKEIIPPKEIKEND